MKNNIEYPFTISSNARKTLITALLLAGVMQVDIVHAAAVNNGDQLTINAGVTGGYYGYVTGGSYIGWDYNGNGVISPVERDRIQQGTQGLIIGITQATGTSHSGLATGTEGGTIDAAFSMFKNTGMHFTVSPVTGSTTNGLDFSGWRETWAGIPSINLGGGMQNCGTTSDGICMNGSFDIGGTFNNGTGIASFAWDGIYGHSYILDYFSIVPQADTSGFGGVPYQLHLEGTVNAVPIPAAVWLFGSGLAGLFAIARRRKP